MAEGAEKRGRSRRRCLAFQRFVFTGLAFGQGVAHLFEKRPIAGAQNAVITHLVKAAGKDMLKEAANELRCFKGHDFPASFPGICVTEGDLFMLYGKDSAGGDGGLVDISGEIGQGLISGRAGLAVDHPMLFPQ